jgi:drug/metabolite transporter (DMT)-like permease
MITLLGLGAALVYGIADFLGGSASRRASALPVLMVSVPVGLTVLSVIAIVTGGPPTLAGLAWGFGSGLAGGAGLITFYRALASGPMSVVAPVSALAAAVLPVVVGTLRGERLAPSVLAGVLLCLVAIALVSLEDRPVAAPETGLVKPGRRFADSGPVMAALSGSAFGVFFVLLREAGHGSGFWPLVASRGAGFLVILTTVLVVRLRSGGRLPGRSEALRSETPDALRSDARTPGPGGGPPADGGVSGGAVVAGTTLVLALASGFLDGFANLLYFLAARAGMLSLAAVLTSLYPAVTVLLARVVYSERLRVIQRLGLAVAVAGIALVTIN